MCRTLISRVALLLATFSALTATSCASIEFERGPYAVRDVEVVYSEQEDITFIAWKLRQDAQLGRVEFELWEEGAWLPISVDETLFAAAPEICGEFWCFQYQVAGTYDRSQAGDVIRSVHDRDGMLAGPVARFRQITTTAAIQPIAIDRNLAFDPNLWEWFAEHDVHLARDWEFKVARQDDCTSVSSGSWTRLDGAPVIDEVGEGGVCVWLRPVHRDDAGVILAARLPPSALTRFSVTDYVPPTQAAPIVYAMLIDLEIPSESRCKQVKNFLIETIEAAVRSRGAFERLGVYTPIDPLSGEPTGGCEQTVNQDYPAQQMLRDARDAVNRHAPTGVKVLWIYVNNVELPPGERVQERLFEFFAGASEPPEVALFGWAIGSNTVIEGVPWDATTGWRPIEDKTFKADLTSMVKRTVPFATMLHFEDTEVPIEPPREAADPQWFKICETTPVPWEWAGVEPGLPIWTPLDPAMPWPQDDDLVPYWRAYIEEQVLVPYASYVRRKVSVVVEVCEAHCDGPYRTRGAADHAQWNADEVCQWQL